MIISDLNHLEVVSEASSIVGGKLDVDVDVDVDPKLNVNKGNVSFVNQVGVAAAAALNGKALAKVKNKTN